MTKIPFRCTAEATPNVSTFCKRLVCFLGSPSPCIFPPGLSSLLICSAVFWYGQNYTVLLLVRSSYAVGKVSEINNWIGKYHLWFRAEVSQALARRLLSSDQGLKSPQSAIFWIYKQNKYSILKLPIICRYRLTQFFETVEKQLCKQKTVLLEEWFSTKWKNENTKLYSAI